MIWRGPAASGSGARGYDFRRLARAGHHTRERSVRGTDEHRARRHPSRRARTHMIGHLEVRRRSRRPRSRRVRASRNAHLGKRISCRSFDVASATTLTPPRSLRSQDKENVMTTATATTKAFGGDTSGSYHQRVRVATRIARPPPASPRPRLSSRNPSIPRDATFVPRVVKRAPRLAAKRASSTVPASNSPSSPRVRVEHRR